MGVNIKTSVKMNKIQKREMEGILDIGEVLFEEGIRDREITWRGVQRIISRWSPIELNALTIKRTMNDLYSEPTILKYAKKGKKRGFFDIRKRRDLNNANMISLTWWGGCFLFINNRIGLEDFALFLDGWERIIDRMKKTKYPWDKHRAALKNTGLSNDRISAGIEDMKEASEENSSYNFISCLNKEDRTLLERDLRRLVKSYFMPFEYGLKGGIADYEKDVESLSHFIFMSLSFEPEEIGEKALAERIKRREEEGRGILYSGNDTVINVSYKGLNSNSIYSPRSHRFIQ